MQRAAAVNTWLRSQKPAEGATAEQLAAWEELRRLPFEQQAQRAGL